MGICNPISDAKNIKQIADEASELFRFVAEDGRLLDKVLEASEAIVSSLKDGGKLLICGNGGSAADAQHFAGEMVGSFLIKNRPGLHAVALNSDTSVLTCLGNDRSYEEIFSHQVGALGRAGDVLIGISTSGNSKNVVLAFEKAREAAIKTISLTGSGGKMPLMADIPISVPSASTPRIQEVHSLLIHMICGYVEERMFGCNGL